MKASFLQNFIDYITSAFQGIKQIKSFRPNLVRKVFSLMGKNEKIIFLSLSTIALISFLFSINNLFNTFTKPAPALGGEYREGILGQPHFLNPLLATSNTDTALIKLIFSGLYKFDGTGKLIPDMAEGMPEMSQDAKKYTIHLKRNLKWHSDKPVTADDVVFTIKTLQDPNYKSPLRTSWLRTSVEKLDDYTVVFTNKDISAPFISNLTLPILPKYVWSGIPADTFSLSGGNLEAIGSGPYVITEIKKLPTGKVQSISMESYSGYHLGRANIANIVFNFYDSSQDVINALHSKEINGFGFSPINESIYLDKTNSQINIHEYPLPQYQAVLFNLKSPGLSDVRVRRALSLLTDKNKILNDVFNGQARIIDGPILPEQLDGFYKKTDPIFDIEGAKKLLDAAGWKLDNISGLRTKNKNILEISLATNDSPINTKTAEIIVSQWKALGIKVNLNVLSNKELSDNLIRPRKFDALLFFQNLGTDPDPFAFWHSSQTKDPGLNVTSFSNNDADKIITEARTTLNAEERAEDYVKFAEIVNAEVPAIFLNQSVFVYAISSKIKNVNIQNLLDAGHRFYDTPSWYIDQKRVWK